MSGSIPDLRPMGCCKGYELMFNPLNRRVICERKTDLATVLMDWPDLAVVRNWGASMEDVCALRSHLKRMHDCHVVE